MTTSLEWSHLSALVAAGRLSLIDYELANVLLNRNNFDNVDPIKDADLAAFVCHLSLSARQGHLCVEITDTIYPTVDALWNENHRSGKYANPGEEDKRLEQDSLLLIEKAILRAVKKLPEKLITKTQFFETHGKGSTPLCQMGDRYYFQRFWYYETLFLYHYKRFTSSPLKKPLDRSVVLKNLLCIDGAKGLLDEQKEAILSACENSLTIICGGPGTGKTYTAGLLIRTLWDSLTDIERDQFEISLAAPTGKAAANLQKSLLKSAKGINKLSNLQSKTLHALLEIKNSIIFEEMEPLSADLVIVDESSMIDVRLMGALFAALKPGARLILLGDPHQLPAVEAGSLFADFVQSPHVKINKLNRCMRAELQAIIDFAEAVNRGDAESIFQLFNQRKSFGDIQHLIMNAPNDGALAKALASYAFDFFQTDKLIDLQPQELLDHFNQFRLLSPLRKGFYGVEEMNRLLSQNYHLTLAKCGLSLTTPFIAPIMLLKNDYSQELFNGEVGVLVKPHYRADKEFGKGDYGLFPGKDGSVRKIPALLLPTFEYAYCLSVHKSQGSEFDHLFLLLPPGAEHFGRELLYTGVTRARRQLTLWGEEEVIRAAIERKSYRLSSIPERLHAMHFAP